MKKQNKNKVCWLLVHYVQTLLGLVSQTGLRFSQD